MINYNQEEPQNVRAAQEQNIFDRIKKVMSEAHPSPVVFERLEPESESTGLVKQSSAPLEKTRGMLSAPGPSMPSNRGGLPSEPEPFDAEWDALRAENEPQEAVASAAEGGDASAKDASTRTLLAKLQAWRG